MDLNEIPDYNNEVEVGSVELFLSSYSYSSRTRKGNSDIRYLSSFLDCTPDVN